MEQYVLFLETMMAKLENNKYQVLTQIGKIRFCDFQILNHKSDVLKSFKTLKPKIPNPKP